MAWVGYPQLAGGFGCRGGLAIPPWRTKHHRGWTNSIVGRLSSGASRAFVGGSHARSNFGLGPYAYAHQFVGRVR